MRMRNRHVGEGQRLEEDQGEGASLSELNYVLCRYMLNHVLNYVRTILAMCLILGLC